VATDASNRAKIFSMVERMRLSSAVVFVRDLDRAVEFYRQLLDLEITMTTGEAVLLSADDADHLVLRGFENATRASGSLGVQYLIWTARDRQDLDRCAQVLQTWNAHVSTLTEDDITIVEGHDPDRTPILVTFPAGPGRGWTRLPTRVFSY
jgi:catechol 2,3-dioxygenase-like lactoylglutathione lyase family enzyme